MEVLTPFNPFEGPEIKHILQTTDAQEEIWYSCYFGGEAANIAYNLSLTIKLQGQLNVNALQLAVDELIARHESLRSSFSPDGNYINVFSSVFTNIDLVDYSQLSVEKAKEAIHNYTEQDTNTAFDLTKGPLIRFALLKLDEEVFNFIITAHHIVCDGWSVGIIMQEISALYSSKLLHKSHNLPVATPYTAYVTQQEELKTNGEFERAETYWLKLFKGEIPKTNLPTDFGQVTKRTYNGARKNQTLDKEIVKRIKDTGIKAGSSLVLTLMGAFEILLYKTTAQKSIVLGLPVAGQSNMGVKNLVGHCVKLLPMKSELNDDDSFIEYLKKRKSDNFDAFENQELTFGSLLKKLNIPRAPGRVPLVPVVFNVDMNLDDDVAFEGLTYDYHSNARNFETFELFLNATGSNDNITLEWSYNTNLFEENTILNLGSAFKTIINQLVENPNAKLSEIIDKEPKQIGIEGASMALPNTNLHELFHKQAEITPNATALEFNKEKITYAEMQNRINATAGYLWQKGIKLGVTVAISLERSPDLIITLFSILQCGARYVPIDTGYPDVRTKLMIADAHATFFICNTSKKALDHSCQTIFVEDIVANGNEDFQKIDVSADSGAYIIYTSGSTGKPKGVQVTHKNVINLLYSMGSEPGISEHDRIFATTTISFDAMVMEIFLPLIHGASIVLVDENTRKDGHLLLQKAIADNITMMWGTPTIWQILLDSGWEKPLTIKALIGGEPVPKALSLQLLEKCNEVWNIYGPTETTVCCILTKITANDNPISIGKPIANTQIYLLDDQRNPVSKGMVGEIVIGGEGVTNGYLGQRELTNERFVNNMFVGDGQSKMYLSGDLGKLLPNGQIECLGRKDGQVKVRGHRIELGEIEHALLKLKGVSAAATDVRNHALKAYIVFNGSNEDWDASVLQWKNQLAEQLPSFMLPFEYIRLKELPVTINGKLDRKSLPDTVLNGEANINEPTRTLTKAEELVCEVWKECLFLNQVHLDDDFFELGGHSLIAAKVMTSLEQKSGQRLPLSSLFEYSTVRGLASLLKIEENTVTWDSMVPIQPKGSKTPLFIVHGAGLNILSFKTLKDHMDPEQPIYGFQAKGLDGKEAMLTSVEEIASHYNDALLATQPKGPYKLAGYSSGGIIAYEMAKQLMDRGEQISTLALLDTYAYAHYGRNSYLGKKLAFGNYIANKALHVLKQLLLSREGFNYRVGVTKANLKKFYLRLKKDKNTLSKMDYDWEYESRIIEHNKVVDKYHLKPLPIKANLFRIQDVIDYTHDPKNLGWKSYAKNGIEVHYVPGEHLTMFSPPNDKILSKTLQNVLDKNN
ncbi:amino acid adenylation domain-containing protein [Maribacter dokdonensis]|uniref:Amino acid adenylation domain-containing protein n=1 Tax=Maribacter dokdonensis TaxID=320912 RepID=A0ABY0UUP1_9FLAO|nr:non-ribosomal peptide synthetase [Maribacter dokdonensis]SDT20184.1 amino acid adenylation domain-containing protein [Maribacter dokdonensis]